jgi:hypothetical protein
MLTPSNAERAGPAISGRARPTPPSCPSLHRSADIWISTDCYAVSRRHRSRCEREARARPTPRRETHWPRRRPAIGHRALAYWPGTSICTIRTRSRVPTACAATASVPSAAWLASPRAVSTSMSRPTMHWPSAHRTCKAVGPRCRCWSPPSDGSRTSSCYRGWEGLDRGPGADPKPSWS